MRSKGEITMTNSFKKVAVIALCSFGTVSCFSKETVSSSRSAGGGEAQKSEDSATADDAITLSQEEYNQLVALMGDKAAGMTVEGMLLTLAASINSNPDLANKIGAPLTAKISALK